MEKVTGTVNNIRNTISVNGGGENSQVTTTHIAIFQIAGRQIKAKSSEPLMINEGDKVIVVGVVKKGVLNVLAHKNLSICIEGNEGWVLRLIFGIVTPLVGIAAISAFLTGSSSLHSTSVISVVLPAIVGGGFIAFGIYNLFCGVRVLQAINELRKDAA